jgi:hypothetical protein
VLEDRLGLEGIISHAHVESRSPTISVVQGSTRTGWGEDDALIFVCMWLAQLCT